MAETELRKRPAAKAATVNGTTGTVKPEPEKPVATVADSEDSQAKSKVPKKKKAFNAVPYIALLLTIASVFTRVYRLGRADFVVWDEAHFGKFASFYIKRSFYFDVHPPLGKTLLGASGLFVGYNGSFPFESGKQYPPELNYTGMRAFCSLIGSLMVPLGFYTGLQLKMSVLASTFLATMVMFDFSVKWVGLFVIALVGLNTLEDLWVMLGDLKMPVRTYARHWIVRIVFLILLPAAVYVFSFWLHFTILNESGEGDAQMSSLFQANLQGNNFHENPISVAYGSKISLKNGARGGGLLHSHIQTYPAGASGSEQQQVTCYHHKDQNNEWIVMTPVEEDMPAENVVQFLYDGDIIRLQHEQTLKLLHSHPLVAPVSKAHWEVSGYGNVSLYDPNDLWVVEIVKDKRPQVEGEKREVRSLTTQFALRHKELGCLLHSGESKNLPEWGFKQAEVYCDKTADLKNLGNLWNVEQHWNSLLPPGGSAAYPQSFWRNFVDLNIAMWQANNALTPDPTKEPDQLTSKPHQWPIMQVGLRMCGWGDNELKYFLLGNPVVWIGSTIALVVFATLCFVYLVRAQRRCGDWKNEEELDDFMFAGKVGVLGWFLHYLPFFIMGRVMYLHHYFPALYFAIILFAFVVDHVAKKTGRMVHAVILLAFTAAVVAVFIQFSDFVFGMDGPATQWAHLKWFSTWNVFDGVAGSVSAAVSGDLGGAGSGSA
ncbi:dolichyl-phosphate-mannose---protein mannosyltransferase [Chytriomyces confervae]|uniref:Dolichyl-phosphate-mannose--protein mannosyltransferase n=1 Tax=Chytriomyces confervae TaxID=246404 RepID=A0A507ER17_9FUNG|nr:dolichyl-phosphate-mannose---protein mannosyltransferase [Chytriomyces confervae]